MRFRRKRYCEAVTGSGSVPCLHDSIEKIPYPLACASSAPYPDWRRQLAPHHIIGWRFQPKRAWKSHSALTQAPCSTAGIWLKLAGRADEEGAVFHLPTGINLAARLWIDLKHADVQSLGQRLQEVETHSQLLLYVVWQNHLVLHAPAPPAPLPSLFCLHFLGELVLFIR